MNERSFHVSLIAIAVMVFLSSTSFAGAMIGLFFGFSLAFFVAPFAFAGAALAKSAGIALTMRQVLLLVAAIYALAVLAGFAVAGSRWARGALPAARLAAAKASLFAALPLMAWLSSKALAAAWP